MSLAKALSGYKSQLEAVKKQQEDIKNEEKINQMLKVQQDLLDKYESENVFKKQKKCYDPSVLEKGGNTHFKVNSKWFRISVLTGSNESDITKYKFHIKNGHGNIVFVSAKSYVDAQAVIDAIYGRNMFSVSGSAV